MPVPRRPDVPRPGVADLPGALLLIGGGGLLVLMLRQALKSMAGRVLTVAGLFVSCVPLCVAGAGTLVGGLGRWAVEDRVVAADGRTYYFLQVSAFQGYTWALARRAGSTPYSFSGGHGETHRGRLAVVRPDPPRRGNYQMYASPNGWVAGVIDGGCVLAYNTRTQWFYDAEDLRGLSPFLLIGATTRLYRPDARALDGAELSGRADAPAASELSGGVRHPNPQVRRLAAALLMRREKRSR